MERRAFLKSAGLGAAAATTIAAPAIAQSQPEIKWRLASSFPKSLDTIYGGAETIAQRVSAATGGKFQIRVFAAGEIVPGLQVLDAVQAGTVEMGHTAMYYYVGKDPTFAFESTIPFGLNTRQHLAWLNQGGGNALIADFLKDYNIVSFSAGQTGAQMGGWYRKEIKTPADLTGLKMRIGGLAGQVLAKLGGVPQQIPGGDIYPALEKGTIDAAEWVGPYDDEKLGFYKVAKYYYYPGWWEGGLNLSAIVNQAQLETLPKEYRAILEAACHEATVTMMSKYDAQNPIALKKLIGSGALLRPFSREILQAAHKAAYALYDELAQTNPKWKKIYEPWKAFRDDQYLWFRVAETTFDNFTFTAGSQRAQ
ncbi:TRAP transporter substrate-binding protein [Elstera cyanobacteriorum]|uniref:ABC transporter substrate-binding protein n=1 Tax=Elstera cyanobacteriorum TaxID=2022747 RepID=A0A255XRE7_9PROT|nr:TRAP transporter substrate-binding protein [Elstera cyanobacteriorum]OYQ19576.1 ABC transporter substrate-binding protein [Elstera cyanobacteriorum]